MKTMKKTVLLAMLLSFASAMYASSVNCAVNESDPACAPTLTVTYQVGNGPAQSMAWSNTPVFTAGSWSLNIAPQTLQDSVFTGGQLVTNADPYVGYSFGVINNSNATMTYSYDFMTPYSGGPYGFLESVFGDVLIDSKFSGTSTVTPVGSAYIMNTYDSGNLLSQVGIGKGCTTVAFVCTSPDAGSIGPLLYTSAASGTLEVKGSFTVTKGGQFTLTGRSALLPVPEPGTLVLLGSGLIGLAGVARRRMSK